MSKYTLISPDSELVEVDDDAVASRLIANGYQVATKGQVAASERPGLAALTGAGRGLTFGVSDQLMTSSGISPEGLKTLKELNPKASLAGEVGGAGVSVFATGGAGLGAKAGMSLGQVVARESAMSGLMGMGSMVSEAALENKELTAEQLAAGGVSGALAGGVFAGTLGLASKGASVISKKLGGLAAKSSLDDIANALEKHQLAGASAKLKRGVKLDDVLEFSKREGVPVDFSPGGLARAEDALENVHARTREVLAKIDSTPVTDPALTSAGRPSAFRSAPVKTVDEVAFRLKERFKGRLAAADDVESFIKNELVPLRENKGLSWEQLYTLQSDLRKKVGPVESTLRKEVMSAGRKELRDAIFEAAEKAGVATKSELLGLQKDFAVGSFLKDTIAEKLAKQEGKLFGGFQLGDLFNRGGVGAAIGGAIGGPPGAVVGGLAGAAASRALRERGPGFAAKALRNLASSKISNGMVSNLKNHFDAILSTAPSILGGYRYKIAEAAAQGGEALLAEHVRLASGPTGQDYLSRTGLPVESQEEVDGFGARFAVLSSIQEQADDYGASLGSASEGLFTGKGGATPSRLSAKDFKETSKSLEALLNNPEKAFESIPPDLMAAAPVVAGQAVNTLLNGVKFLHGKMPKNPYANMPESIAPKWEPSPADLDRFNRYKEAVESPAKALKNMANGYVSPEQVEAIKAVYPAIYADLQQKIGERLAEWKKPLSYSQKLALSNIVGPSALAMSPQQVQLLQSATAKLSSGGEPLKAPDGRQSIDTEKNMQTQSQRLEARGNR